MTTFVDEEEVRALGVWDLADNDTDDFGASEDDEDTGEFEDVDNADEDPLGFEMNEEE